MKKSSFVALMMGTVSGVLFALGMCMALLPEWNALTEGVVLGIAGIALGIVTYVVWSRMEHHPLPKFSMKSLLLIAYAVVSALVLGVGMCLCLMWEVYVWGVLVGLVGILMLVMLIPMLVGLK